MSDDTRILVYVNQKGGTGKSTLAYNHALYLAEIGKRVLFIDGDEQDPRFFGGLVAAPQVAF